MICSIDDVHGLVTKVLLQCITGNVFIVSHSLLTCKCFFLQRDAFRFIKLQNTNRNDTKKFHFKKQLFVTRDTFS